MRYFYDFEFYEDGSTIQPISVGFVAQDGRELYLENANFDWHRVRDDHWLWENVYPHLEGADSEYAESRFVMGEKIREFINTPGDDTNELWGYYSDYDHVCLAQLYGTMANMPSGIPWFTLDIKQEEVRLGSPVMPEQDGLEHHALADARHNRTMWKYLKELELNA